MAAQVRFLDQFPYDSIHLREGYGDRVFKTPVRMDARVREAPSHKESVVTYAPTSRASQDYKAVARELVARLTKSPSRASRTPAGKGARRARRGIEV